MIDAHQHFWRLGQNDCTWPTGAEAAIYRDFLPEDWLAVAAPCGVTGSVLVQSQESARDTAWLLDLAEQHEFILGVVGWTDLTVTDFPQSPWLKGLRPMVQDREADYLDNLAFTPSLHAMAARGLVFDALVRPHHLPSLQRMARRNPGLRIVIDHCAKPAIAADGNMMAWQRDMDELADLPNVACKLSGLLTEADGRDVRWAIDWVADVYAPDRLLWGSEWPVLNLAGEYAGWLALAKSSIPEAAHAAVFNDNARRIYRL